MNKEQKNKLLRQGLLDGLDRLIEKNQGNRQMFDDEGYVSLSNKRIVFSA